VKVSWSATYNGVAVDPCNTTVAAGKPGFFNAGRTPADEGSFSLLRTYAQGDDFILGKASSPGQPTSLTMYASGTYNPNNAPLNTTCANNVATTTWTVDAGVPAGTRARIAIQGKPTVPVPAGFADSLHAAEWPYTTMYARAKSPTYEYTVGSGAKASARRAIADTSACLKCHVGSLYQHGNNRVDNVDLCVMCHNSASSDQNNRVTMKVDATEAYDGKVGQTYEFKSMLHAIHSAGGQEKTFSIYRTRGIYAWTPEGVTPPNWPTGAPTCRASTDGAAPAPITGNLVFGADPAVSQSCQTHNLYHPTYPRAANECGVCHVSTFAYMPDQTKAVATTVDAGTAPWTNQLDDVLQGATSAACTSCHQSSAAAGHANQNGWVPSKFDNGRQTIIDAAK